MKKIASTIILGSLFVTLSVHAADIAAGKEKAAICAGCHGAEGITANPEWPNLAGQNIKYLENQLKAFRTGVRKNDMMSPMAQGLNDDDVTNVAAYFNSLKSN